MLITRVLPNFNGVSLCPSVRPLVCASVPIFSKTKTCSVKHLQSAQEHYRLCSQVIATHWAHHTHDLHLSGTFSFFDYQTYFNFRVTKQYMICIFQAHFHILAYLLVPVKLTVLHFSHTFIKRSKDLLGSLHSVLLAFPTSTYLTFRIF